MKIFWSIIAVLAIITASLLIASRNKAARGESNDLLPRRVYEAGSRSAIPAGEGSVDPGPATPSPLNITPDQIASRPQPGHDAIASNPDRLRQNRPVARMPSETPTGQPEGGDAAALTPNAPAEIVVVEPGVQSGPTDGDRQALVPEPEADDTLNRDQTAAPGASQPTAIESPSAPGADWPTLEIIPSTFEQREDGSTLVDGRFVVRGTGTKADPWQVPWEMLVSTSQVYDPRATVPKLPQRATMLSGTYVRMVGYIAFPVEARTPDEMLVMRHDWDGCCVGVRPETCDAVSVRLDRPVTSRQLLMSWGSVTGRFNVGPHVTTQGEPYLYRMDDAVLAEESK